MRNIYKQFRTLIAASLIGLNVMATFNAISQPHKELYMSLDKNKIRDTIFIDNNKPIPDSVFTYLNFKIYNDQCRDIGTFNVANFNIAYILEKKEKGKYILDTLCEGPSLIAYPEEGIQTIYTKQKIYNQRAKYPPICVLVMGGDYRIKYYFHYTEEQKYKVLENNEWYYLHVEFIN